MANIGQGGMQGVAAYAAAKKQRAAERTALGKEELSVRRLEQLEESEKSARDLTAEYKKAGFSQQEANAAERRIQAARDDARMHEAMYAKNLDTKYKNKDFDPKEKAAYNAEMAALYQDPKYISLVKIGFPNIEIPKLTTNDWSIKAKK
jgi:hypothetical protein